MKSLLSSRMSRAGVPVPGRRAWCQVCAVLCVTDSSNKEAAEWATQWVQYVHAGCSVVATATNTGLSQAIASHTGNGKLER